MSENIFRFDQALQNFLSQKGIEFISLVRRGWSNVYLSIYIHGEKCIIETSAAHIQNEIERDFILYGDLIERIIDKLNSKNEYGVADEDLTELNDIYAHFVIDNEITVANLTIKIMNDPEIECEKINEEKFGICMRYENGIQISQNNVLTFEDIVQLEEYFGHVKEQILDVRNFRKPYKVPEKTETEKFSANVVFKKRVDDFIVGPEDFGGEDFF